MTPNLLSLLLQLLKARNQTVTEPIIRKVTSGMKEADSSFNVVLNNLFAPMSKQRVKELGFSEDQDSKYVDRISRDVEASGALDRVALGIPPSARPFCRRGLT